MTASRCKFLPLFFFFFASLSGLNANLFPSDSADRPTAQTLLRHHPFCAPDPKYNFLESELYAKIRHVL